MIANRSGKIRRNVFKAPTATSTAVFRANAMRTACRSGGQPQSRALVGVRPDHSHHDAPLVWMGAALNRLLVQRLEAGGSGGIECGMRLSNVTDSELVLAPRFPMSSSSRHNQILTRAARWGPWPSGGHTRRPRAPRGARVGLDDLPAQSQANRR